MKQHVAWLGLFGLATALGCAGKRLNDVGDLNTAGAGDGGAGDGSGGTAGTTGGGGAHGNEGGGVGVTGGTSGAGGANGGTSGVAPGGGTAGDIGGTGGGGVGVDIGACNEGDGCVFEEGTDIRALAADTTHLYWVEYGTTDELGNYNNDGRLLSRAFDTDEVTTLATDLAGSLGIFVTSTHAYAIVDRVWQDGGERYALVRVPREGGESQMVYVDLTTRGSYGKCGYDGTCFYTYEDAGYWVRTDGLWEITAGSDEAVRIADASSLEMSVDPFGVDESHLYYIDGDYGPSDPIELWKMPRTGGDAELVTNDARHGRHALSGDYIYALQGTLFRMPKAGGRWTALAELFANPGYQLSIVADRFYFDGQPATSIAWSLGHGRLSDPETAAVIVDLPAPPESWVVTTVGAYWTDGSTIYLRSVD